MYNHHPCMTSSKHVCQPRMPKRQGAPAYSNTPCVFIRLHAQDPPVCQIHTQLHNRPQHGHTCSQPPHTPIHLACCPPWMLSLIAPAWQCCSLVRQLGSPDCVWPAGGSPPLTVPPPPQSTVPAWQCCTRGIKTADSAAHKPVADSH